MPICIYHALVHLGVAGLTIINTTPLCASSHLYRFQHTLTLSSLMRSINFASENRAGNTGMPTKYLNENVQAIVATAIDKIPSKWANVRSISIKLPDSTSLPVYNKTPEELEEIARLAGSTKKAAAEEMKEDETKEKSKKATSEEKKRKKKDLAAKSPLVRALKKQKLAKKEDEAPAAEAPAAVKSARKKKKSEKTPAPSVTKEEGKADSAATEKKKKRKQSEDDAVSSKKQTKNAASKEDFIPSKKFVGSKKGYAFYRGKKGLGYYIDIPPKVDKVAMAALARLANTPMKGGRRAGKKGGRGWR